MIPLAIVGGVIAVGLGNVMWSYGYEYYWKPRITPDAAPTDNFKREYYDSPRHLLARFDKPERVCKLQFDIYQEENWHQSLYDYIAAKFNDKPEDIIVAYQGKLVHLRGPDHGFAREQRAYHDKYATETAEGDDGLSFRILFDDAPADRRLMSFNSATLILLNEGERKRYDREVFGPVLFSESYAGEKVTEEATEEDDMDEWKIGNEKMRRLQKDLNERLC